MKLAIYKQIIFTLIIFIAVILILEGAARLLESQIRSGHRPAPDRSGWQTEFFGSLFEWHEPDPDLLWRFRAGLDNPLMTTNSDHMIGPEISRTKPPNTYRVLIAGDSSPVGLGLASRRQTFAEALRFLLDQYFVSRKEIEVINAAVSGYSSEQVRRFMEIKGWGYEPDLVIIYCGNNDASISGPLTDRELLSGQRFKSLRRSFSHLAIYRVMRDLMRPQNTSSDSVTPLKLRVSPKEYGENLTAIAEQAQSHSCPVIFLIPPVPYLWPAGLQFKPFLHLTGADGQILLPPAMMTYLGQDIAYCLDSARFQRLYGEGDLFTRAVYESAYTDSLNPDAAVDFYTARMRGEPDNPVWLNNLGVACWRNDKYDRADSAFHTALGLFRRQHSESDSPIVTAAASPFLYNLGINNLSRDSGPARASLDSTSTPWAYLDSALQADYFSLRIKRPYVRQFESLRGRPSAAVIDLPLIFRENGGERLFIDHCHPTAEGHLLIAKTIYDTIRGRRW